MILIVPQSVVCVILITIQLKWAWDFLLYQSFFYPNGIIRLSEYSDDDLILPNRRNPTESVECAVCLSKIDERDEVRELRCEHLFHRACLDRWIGYGHMTCPLCRTNLRPPPPAASQLHHELVLIDIRAAGYSDGCAWWLR